MFSTAQTISDLGTITFVQSPRARRLSISIKPFKPIRVTVPAKVSQARAKQFLQSNLRWITKALAKMKKVEQQKSTQADSPPINRAAAKTALTARLNYLTCKYSFSCNRVFIRNQKTRWGSCSRNNNINLNMNLVRLPQELQDYVILHELVHTKIKNHSRRFWVELDKYVVDAKMMAKKLRNNSLSMFHCAV
ncbi:MAG: YgjP-like metallopeptidase domain-containing protein [Sedimentisphaerales bacterium]